MAIIRVENNNITSVAARHHFDVANRQAEHALRALASGERMVSGADDPASFAISESLKAQLHSVKQGQANASQAQSFIQVAEGALNEQNNILIRLRELGVQSASDTVSDTEREFLDNEFTQLSAEFDRIAQTTRFGSQHLLTGANKNFQFQVGAAREADSRIEYTLDANTTGSEMGIDSISVSDRDSARDALEVIDEALTSMGGVRANFGAMQARLQIAQDHAATEFENLSEARSRLADADVAEEASNLARARILQESAASVLAQANQDSLRVLKLLN